MRSPVEGAESFSELRRQAEAILREKIASSPSRKAALSTEDALRALHELSVHQIELEMQSEALQQALAELDAERKHYFDFYDLAPVGYVTVSEQGVILEGNLTAAGMLGVLRNAMVNQPLSGFILAEDQDTYNLYRKRLFETRVPQSWELRLVPSDGLVFWAHLQAGIAQDASGASLCRLVVSDITERKAVENGLRGSHELLSLFVRKAPIYAFIKEVTSVRNLVLLASDNFQQMIGIPGPEMVGKTMEELFPAGMAEKIKADDWAVVSSGKVLELEEELSGRSYTSVKFPIVQGERTLLAGFSLDTTERKMMESALQERERQLNLFIQNAPAAIAMLDRDMRYIFASRRWLRDYRLEAQDIIGRSHYEVFPEIPERWKEVHRRCLAGATESCNEDPFPRPDGTLDWVRWEILPWMDGSGQIGGIIILSEVVTDRKNAELALQESEKLRFEAQKLESLGTLAAGVAHNINNVLSIILGTASMHEEDATEPALRGAFSTIGNACIRGRDLVKSLVRFARPSLSNISPLELHLLIEEVCGLLEGTTRNQVKVVEAFAEEPLWINGDAGSLNHVLLNLCLNSIDAMPSGGTITIRTSILPGGWVGVSVEDDGRGMDPEVLAHVMEPFYTTREVGQGTGLGLSMTYGVVKAHGGTIEITSQPGRGTAVKLRFPRIPGPAQNPFPPARIPPPALVKVALVDDDPDVRLLMARMLKQAGVRQVETFAGGEDVLQHLGPEGLPDLVILDQNMPGMNGVQTMERIRNLHPDMPILISSGQPDIEEWDCFHLPKVGVISKPFTIDEIQARLAQFAGACSG